MSSSQLQIESLMIHGLKRDMKAQEADTYIGTYFAVKGKLYTDFLEWIRANEPQLSDHSSTHVDDVLNNAYDLLESIHENLRSKDPLTKVKYTGFELYILCMTILFHDVGNFFKRQGHNQEIETVINDLFSDFFYGIHRRDKSHIIRAGRAHTGKHNSDTLKDVAELEHSNRFKIHLRQIAAIVRLADELAEGSQRTCSYMLEKGLYEQSSNIYHEYAASTQYMIDALNGRINITYDIELNWDEKSGPSEDEKKKIIKFLEFIHVRINKLNQERKYCGYYCETLKKISETQVSFNFSNKKAPVNTDYKALILTDLTVPGDNEKNIIAGRDDLQVLQVVESLVTALSHE